MVKTTLPTYVISGGTVHAVGLITNLRQFDRITLDSLVVNGRLLWEYEGEYRRIPRATLIRALLECRMDDYFRKFSRLREPCPERGRIYWDRCWVTHLSESEVSSALPLPRCQESTTQSEATSDDET